MAFLCRPGRMRRALGRTDMTVTETKRRARITLKNAEQLAKMRESGRLVRKVLNHCHEICRPGITTAEISRQCREIYTDAGASGLFKNYPTYKAGEGFPGDVCISVNDEVVHGIPGDRVIRDGDVVSIDCGVLLNGWCGDAATTVMVGNVDPAVQQLCEHTERVLQLAIDNIKPGRRWSQIARLMQNYVERHGYGVVKNFVGHGLGQSLHEEPQVPNYYDPRDPRWRDFDLREGLVLAIEPMCILGGDDQTEVLDDGWTVKSLNRLPAAHYEHTIAVVKGGVDVLTDGR